MKSGKSYGRLIIFLLMVLTLAGGIGFYLQDSIATPKAESSVANPPALTVTTSTVQEQPLESSLVVTGSVVARDETLIGSEIAGLRVIEILVDEGDWVSEGQLLARLNSRSLQAQLAQYDAAVERARATISLQKSAIKEAEVMQLNAETRQRRGDKLTASIAISVEEQESLQTTAKTAALKTESARFSLTVGEADLMVVEAQRDQIKIQISQTEIRATCSGLISKRMAKLGNVVNANSELFRMVVNGLIELDAQVAENDLAAIQSGQRVLVGTAAKASSIVEGTVRSVAPTVDPATRLGTVHVTLPMNSPIKPGQFVRGEIMFGKYTAKVIPDAAILYHDTVPYVYVVGEDSSVSQRTIQVGRRQHNIAEIRNGLVTGEKVVLQGSGYLKPGDRIRVADAKFTNSKPALAQESVQ